MDSVLRTTLTAANAPLEISEDTAANPTGSSSNRRLGQKECVVILYNTAWYIYNFRRGLIASLQSRGYEVVAVSPPDFAVEKLINLGVKHIPISLAVHGINPIKEVLSLWKLYLVLKELKPKTILSYTIKCNLYAGLLSRILGYKQVANIPGLGRAFDAPSLLRSAAIFLYRLCLGRVQRVFFQNRQDLKLLSRIKAVPKGSGVAIAGSGIDLESFSIQPLPALSPMIFLIVGRLIPKKGFDAFLEAAVALHGPLAEFWIAGSADAENRASQDLLQRIKSADSKGQVKYLGWVDNVANLISKAHVVVLPSTYNEGVPRSLIEALAIGRPIITTDWKGCRETLAVEREVVAVDGVRQGKNGLLVAPNDPKALTRACCQIMMRARPELEILARESRLLAETKFDERKIIDLYLQEVAA